MTLHDRFIWNAGDLVLVKPDELTKEWDESKHPRVPAGSSGGGQFGSGGGGVSESDDAPVPPIDANTATARGIKGLPKDIKIKDHLLAQAQERGVWAMSAKEKPKGDFDSSKRTSYRLNVKSRIPEGIEQFERKPEYQGKDYYNPPRMAYYNPKLADLQVVDADEPLLKATIAKPKAGYVTEIAPLPDKDVMYRGMRAEEYENFLATGEIKSRGDYNLGEAQIGVTSWSTDVGTAEYYANGFAPWPHKATFEKPAYVVAARVPLKEHIRDVPGTGENELNVTSAITPADVVAVFRGDVYWHDPGNQDIRPISYDKNESVYEPGGGTSPSSSVVWQREDVGSIPTSGEHPGEGYSKEAKLIDGVIHTSNVYDAVRALHEDRPVELDQPRSVSVLLDKLGAITKDMIEKGEKAPTFNLCNVTIKGSSLFCADSVGIPRVEMPQIPEGDEGKFQKFLADKGYQITNETQFASYLRATQNELNGSKVAGIARDMRENAARYDNPIFVSNDDYILDGHHRWAAKVGSDAEDNILGNSTTMAITRVGISITKLLEEAEAFTGGKGKRDAADERKKQWLLACARARELLKTFNEADHPRDEHGRWTDGGSSDDGGGPRTFDTAKIEAKTKVNVAAASAKAKADGTKPLPGSKAEHPATIASRNPTALKATATPKGHYGQPDVASMKLEPARYDHDIGLFRNDTFYPNFRAADLSGSTDSATSAVLDQMKGNLKYLYQFADKHTQVWYDGARALVDDRAELWGFNDASVAGVYAALSPTKDWDQNVHIGDMLMKTYKTQQATKWDKKMDAKAKSLWSKKLQPLVEKVRGKTLGELTDPKEKGMWIRTYDETHNKSSYRTVLPNGALGPVARNLDGGEKKVIWQSLSSISNAVKALEANGDRDKISEAMGLAHKVRSFYNNILDPHSENGDVTIDTHAVGVALLRQLGSGSIPVAHNFGDTPGKLDQPVGWDAAGASTKTGLKGLYPVYAQAYREAAKELGIQPRQLQSAVWVVKRETFGNADKKTQEAIEAAWRKYHDDPDVTLAQTRDAIGRLLGLGTHERTYAVDERGRGRADPRELHRAELGSAAAAVDRRAGARAAGRAAGLELVRTERRRAGPEISVKLSAHAEWMNECVPQLMDYGKDQDVAIAACLNMWRDAWEEAHPDGADDPGPDRPTDEEGSDLPRRKLLSRLRAYNESEHPRDEHGRWTDGGGGDDAPASAPAPAPAREADEKLLLVTEAPRQEQIDGWIDDLTKRSEELAAQGQAGNSEDYQIGGMHVSLNNYLQEWQKDDAGINIVYDGNKKLKAAAFSYVDGKVAIIRNFGAVDHKAGVKVLQQAAAKWADRTDQIEGEFWADDTVTRAMYEEAGFKERSKTESGRVTMVKTDLPGGGITKQRATMQKLAADTAKKLDFDPAMIEYTEEERQFELGGLKYSYAGSYTHGLPQIKLYMGQLSPENIVGVSAHEIGHRKFELLREVQRDEVRQVLAEPGPPPDPNHKYWWGKRGGTDAVMAPDGTLRPPYDEKYPVYNEWARIENIRPSLEQDDGITPYSKTYWAEWEKGKMDTSKAYHETMAEISRAQGEFGRHSAQTSKGWRDLYALQEKVWAAADTERRNNPPPVPKPKWKSLEYTVIESRDATVIYLDDNFVPVAKEAATLAKIIFDDGANIFVTPTK